MLHHFTIETDREVDSAELLEGVIEIASTGVKLLHDVRIVGGHVDRDAAAAERAIAKRDRAIRCLVEEVTCDAYRGSVTLAILAALPGFPAEVIDTIRHVCGIDAPVEVES